MVDPFPGKPYSFRTLRKAFGPREAGYLCHTEPVREKGRLDQVDRAPDHHPAALDRLLGRGPRRSRTVNQSGGELPGRKLKGRR